MAESPKDKALREAKEVVQRYLESPEYKAETKAFVSTMEAMGIKVPENTDEKDIRRILIQHTYSGIFLKYLIEDLEKIGIENQEFYEIPQANSVYDDFIVRRMAKRLGCEIPQDVKITEDLKVPESFWRPFEKHFEVLSDKLTDKTNEYLNNLELKTFCCNQKLTEDEKERWMNIYILSKEYHLDTLIESSENYRNTGPGFLRLPIRARDIMGAHIIDFYHHEYLEKYLFGLGVEILGMYFCPKHLILTSQSGNELRFYVYIRPSALSDEIILSCDEGEIQVLSKKDIEKESLQRYLIYSEKNVKDVIRKEKMEEYLKQKNGN